MDHVEIPGSQYGECIVIDEYQGQINESKMSGVPRSRFTSDDPDLIPF